MMLKYVVCGAAVLIPLTALLHFGATALSELHPSGEFQALETPCEMVCCIHKECW